MVGQISIGPAAMTALADKEHGKTTVVFLKKVARPAERLPSMIVQYEFAMAFGL